MTRADGRAADELRPVRFEVGVQRQPAGSALVAFGDTRVLCAVSVADTAPRWRPSGGWLTAEYAMLPGATSDRKRRERQGAGGRTREIERLIGRSLRAVVDLDALGERTLTVDCDVIEADGGTRTAAITGGWVALVRALEHLGLETALRGQVAAVSVGVVDGEVRVDLPYEEDHRADVDMNVVALTTGDDDTRFVEIQGTAEGAAFDRVVLDDLLDRALDGCEHLFGLQRWAAGRGGQP